MAAKNQFVFGKVSAGHLTKEVLCHRLITNLYVWLYQWMVITNALNVSMSLREIFFVVSVFIGHFRDHDIWLQLPEFIFLCFPI